jgi:probable phosphoglycerate mutase
VILVRHGRTAWNRVERFRGRADVSLDDVGLVQAAATGRRLAATESLVAIYTSPLGRAVETGQAIGKACGVAVQPHTDLIDIDYGQWQGLTPEDARAGWPVEVDAWYRTPQTAAIPGGEALAEVRRRGLAAVRELAGQHAGESIVLVGHTVINRAILLGVLGLGDDRFWRIHQEPCAINVFEVDGDDFTLVALNDTGHLVSV